MITCDKLKIGYDEKNPLGVVDFHLDKGDFLAIIGENGTGKSTLLKTILGLQERLGGSYRVEGLMGYMPQISQIKSDFPASVMEVVLSAFQVKKGLWSFYNAREKEVARSKLEELGIEDLACKRFSNLSGGQKQRVLLARTLCSGSDIIALDEPTNGLDPSSTRDLYKTLKDLSHLGKTVILISHDVEDVLENASHVLVMGKNPWFGKVKEYMGGGRT